MKLLPKYSPELNPCELLFGRVKNHLRNNRDDERFWIEIMKALTIIEFNDVIKAYHAMHI